MHLRYEITREEFEKHTGFGAPDDCGGVVFRDLEGNIIVEYVFTNEPPEPLWTPTQRRDILELRRIYDMADPRS